MTNEISLPKTVDEASAAQQELAPPVAPSETLGANGLPKGVRGFTVGRFTFRYVPCPGKVWAHNEGACDSHTICSMVWIVEEGYRTGWRVVFGRHSFRVFF